MLWTLEQHLPFDRCLEVVASAGYTGVELVGEFQHWDTGETGRLLARMRSLGLTVDAMSGVKAGFAVPAETDAFHAQFLQQVEAAKALGCSRLILLSGKRVDGIAAQEQTATAVENLKRAAEAAAQAGMDIVIEPIDPLEDPHVFLQSVTEAFAIVRTVGNPRLRVLYDLYHEQRGFGNLLEKLEKNLDFVGLIHVADVPGRHEPGTGEIDFDTIFRRLGALHYSGWIAMEYYPTADPVASLRKARVAAEQALQASRANG